MIFSAVIFTAGRIYWITPGEKAHENLLQQMPAIEARAGQVLSEIPDMAGLRRSFRQEERRLKPLQEETTNLERQLLTETSAILLAEKAGAKLEKISETSQLPYAKAEYRLIQQGDYPELLASLNRFEAASSFLKFSSLTMEKTGNQVLLHAGFSVLTASGDQASKSLAA